MNPKELKALHKQFSKLPLSKGEWQSKEYDLYIHALQENKEFYEWTLEADLKQSGFNFQSYCCLQMAHKVHQSFDENIQIKHDDVDVVINVWENGTFGIPIHDGGTSIIEINYCPWCGSKLKN